MMDWDAGWGVGGWLAMSLMMVVFWGGLIALIVLLIRGAAPRHVRHGGPPADIPAPRAEEVLAERFARGEIDEEEFTRRREVLDQR